MTIQFSPQQFAAAVAALKTQKGVTVTPKNDNEGNVQTSKADFAYSFNGTQLLVSLTAKHGLVKLDSDDDVYAHIKSLLEAV